MRRDLSARRRRPTSAAAHDAAAGVLLRLPVGAEPWAEQLPAVPTGHDVTVSFSCVEAQDEHADVLALLGYRVVACRGAAADPPSADFLVSRELLERRPAWSRALGAHAQQVFDLGLGPVLALLSDSLGVHRPDLR